MRVRPILNADHAAHAAEIGESIICDQMPYPPVPIHATTCRIGADVELELYKPHRPLRIRLCRVRAEELAAQLRECLDLLDARDVSGWKS